MADNNNYDMQRLQQDAIRRTREMQARAQSALQSQNPPTPSSPGPARTAPVSPAPPPRHMSPPEHVPLPEAEPRKGPLAPVSDIFEALMKDSEKTLILVLIILLVEEKADTGVIFALMYLIL